MEPVIGQAQRFKDYQSEMSNHVGYLSVIRTKYGNRPIPAPMRADMDDSARTLKRITVNDILRDNGYGSNGDSSDTDSNIDDNYSVCNDKNIGMITNLKNCEMSNSNNGMRSDDSKLCNTVTNLVNDTRGENSQMDMNIEYPKVTNTEGLNSNGVYDDSINGIHNGIGNSLSSESINVHKSSNNVNRIVYTVHANDIHNSRIVNNCIVYDVPNGEITAADADSQVMNVVPQNVSSNPNSTNENDDRFQVQGAQAW
ncbi:hypothetical protein AVEN_152546-1 [Araneus ventricosus]|uniref:Uncharacterized protein n=1 Tax=Araneus ventricosus TaxID=182803 RepID=A0A4Y2MAS6_ARAVE|nr:hypothetical protein AVEN_152546-1 [Araneus ventricosus]